MREQLRRSGVSEPVVDDAVLILSELLSNSCRHGRPLGAADAGEGAVRASWRVDDRGALTVEVTDGGGPTRPMPSTPSVTARGGRGLNIIDALSHEWGVRDGAAGEVTVWALVAGSAPRPDGVATRVNGHRRGSSPLAGAGAGGVRGARAARTGAAAVPLVGDLGFLDVYGDAD